MAVLYRKSYTIVCWAYEAALHCNDCALDRFGPVTRHSGSGAELDGVDSECNVITPVFLDQIGEIDSPSCDDCFEPIE